MFTNCNGFQSTTHYSGISFTLHKLNNYSFDTIKAISFEHDTQVSFRYEPVKFSSIDADIIKFYESSSLS